MKLLDFLYGEWGVKLVEKRLVADVWADRKLLLGKQPCLF